MCHSLSAAIPGSTWCTLPGHTGRRTLQHAIAQLQDGVRVVRIVVQPQNFENAFMDFSRHSRGRAGIWTRHGGDLATKPGNAPEERRAGQNPEREQSSEKCQKHEGRGESKKARKLQVGCFRATSANPPRSRKGSESTTDATSPQKLFRQLESSVNR